MWFQKNNYLKLLTEWTEKVQNQADSHFRQQTDSVEMLNQTMKQISRQINSLEQRYSDSEKMIRRQSDSFEDLLDEIQSQKQEQNTQYKQQQETLRREQAFLTLISCLRDQMYLLEQKMTKDDLLSEEKKAAWTDQFLIMNQEAVRFMAPCGLTEVGKQGDPIDYDIHNILNTIETGDESKANTVAKVYSRGIFYNGQLIKKADVAAFNRK